MFDSAAKIGKPPVVHNQLEALVAELVAAIHGIFASLGEAAKAYHPVIGPNGPTTILGTMGGGRSPSCSARLATPRSLRE